LEYRLSILSSLGILFGICLYAYEFSFGELWGCFCAANGPCECPVPFSVYFYGYILPVAIVAVFTAALVWSTRRQKRPGPSTAEKDVLSNS